MNGLVQEGQKIFATNALTTRNGSVLPIPLNTSPVSVLFPVPDLETGNRPLMPILLRARP
jgi:hypothetical protein